MRQIQTMVFFGAEDSHEQIALLRRRFEDAIYCLSGMQGHPSTRAKSEAEAERDIDDAVRDMLTGLGWTGAPYRAAVGDMKVDLASDARRDDARLRELDEVARVALGGTAGELVPPHQRSVASDLMSFSRGLAVLAESVRALDDCDREMHLAYERSQSELREVAELLEGIVRALPRCGDCDLPASWRHSWRMGSYLYCEEHAPDDEEDREPTAWADALRHAERLVGRLGRRP